ncbi:FAD-dependent monooxygenase [Sphingomonas sp. CFBP 13728]|uniref:NAD(P)/FAD-dependent oxidoreductase n=1 Tax=Sphingomonas sp. CFBP 13728 TaxID=2775294 RepID=UPI001784479F|nr:FAD-dependent monooxygenase [Sphingomonas sp. CFBP 13728]MBD8619537.1 FAD-dependent monooxygenase [Sphingomonas sp. CFBP 13728]
MRRTPALIVGGGLAGAATAIRLARAGLPHLLVERSRETGDAICGGFLSWRTLETLAGLGIDPDTLNPERVTRARIFAGNRRAEAALPHPAVSVTRHRLDTVLLAEAERLGTPVERGVTVREIDGTSARLADGATIVADALFLASGKHDVRGMARPDDARGADPTLGIRVRIAPSPALGKALAGGIELHLFDRGYAGLAMQEDGTANLCMAVHRSRLQAAGSPAQLLEVLGREMPALGEWVALIDPIAQIDAIANVPYGWRQRNGADALFRLGDQAGVIPSLAGEGMGIALASGVAAARAYENGGPAAASSWQEDFTRRLARPIGIAGIVRHIAESERAAWLLPFLRPTLIQVIANATRLGQS